MGTSDTELRPCPFCRSEHLTVYHDDYACSCKIQCECGCSVEWSSDCMTKEDLEKLVIEKWNTRAYPQKVIEDYFRKQLSVNCECGTPIISDKKICPKCGRNWSEHD